MPRIGINGSQFDDEEISNFGNQQQLNVMSADYMNVASDYKMTSLSNQHIHRRPATTMDYNTMPIPKNGGNHYSQLKNKSGHNSELNAQQSKA